MSFDINLLAPFHFQEIKLSMLSKDNLDWLLVLQKSMQLSIIIKGKKIIKGGYAHFNMYIFHF